MGVSARLNPFRSVPNRGQVLAWGMYDLANQSFTLLITTLYFAVYFDRFIAPDPKSGETWRNLSFGAASLVVVLMSPLLGAVADFTGRKKSALRWSCIGCSLGMMGLAVGGPGQMWLILLIYCAANICFMAGESFLAAFLPEISTRENVGTVSAIGWTMGYVGALVCLPISLFMPGMRASPPGADAFRWVFVFAGLWFLLGAAPTLLVLRERKVAERLPPGRTLAGVGFSRLGETVRQIRQYRELGVFLTFFLIYCCGMQVVIVNAAVIAGRYMSVQELIIFTWALAAISGVGSIAGGVTQGLIGLKPTVMVSLGIWVATALGAAALPPSGAVSWHLWLVGAGVGLGLGMTGTASRALVGVFTPAHRTAEFFSFWGLGYRVAGAVGPAIYAWVVSVSTHGQRDGMLAVAASFVLGLVGMMMVNVGRGRAAAERAEREHAAPRSTHGS